MVNFQNVKNAVLPRIRPNAKIDAKKVAYETAKDTFERKNTVLDVAKDFRKRVLDTFEFDWKEGVPLPGEDGYELLRQTMASYTTYIEKLNPSDAEKFTRLAMGERQLSAIEDASRKNVDVRLFKETLEKSLGRSIRSIVKPD